VLVLLGGYTMTWVSALAMVLIVSGAVIGSWDLFTKRWQNERIKR
jgi:hypothetical protein